MVFLKMTLPTLANQLVLQGIVTEELGRLGMSGRVVQTSGVSLKSQLVKLDKTVRIL